MNQKRAPLCLRRDKAATLRLGPTRNFHAAADASHRPTRLEVVSITGLIPLAPNDVKDFFTLFPKCFSSFVHTTCSLSDLVQYLALAEVHLPVCTALSNCTTLGTLPHLLERSNPGAARQSSYGTIALLGSRFLGASSGCPGV